jgi:glycosyltransferase involved in cell wall biosynthesis
MKRNFMDFSIIIPIHNEEPVLEENTVKLYEHLRGVAGLDSFEIILALNGCTDASEKIAEGLAGKYPEVKSLYIEGRGLGVAILRAARSAQYEMMMFYAIDLPFGTSVIAESIEAAAKNDGAVVIGSKGHRDSVVQRGPARWLFSTTISILNNLLFGLGVKDTQGSILFYGETIRKYYKLMDSPGAFFQTQLLIYSKLTGHRLVEIPVRLTEELRKTRFSLASDGLGYLSAIFREKVKLIRCGIG